MTSDGELKNEFDPFLLLDKKKKNSQIVGE